MTTYNTGNPVGSSDPRDIYDNAQNLDELVNSPTKTSHDDRRGNGRKTWHGMESEFDADQVRRESEHDEDQARRESEFDADQSSRENEFVDTQADKQQRFNAFIAASGYEFIGDYAAGIEVTEYNQIIRDAAGEFWRLTGATATPYTTTGAGMPEVGAFRPVGDAALRQDLVQPVATFNNVADMKNATGLGIGRKARTLGYYAPGDGGGNDYEIVAAGAGSNYGFLFEQLTASGHEAKLLGGGIMEDKTAYIPTDFATLQEAIDDLSKLRPAQGVTIDLMIESGHQPTSGISVKNADYGMFAISSEDAVVTAASTVENAFIYASNARAPVLNCLVDFVVASSFGAYGLDEASTGKINPGCGVMNGTRGAHIQNGSECYMDAAVFTGFQQAGLHVSRNSSCQCSFSNLSGNSLDPTNTFGGVYASRASEIHGADIDASNSGGDGVRAQKSATVAVPGVNVSGTAKIALVAVSAAHIYSGNSAPIMTGLKGRAIVALQAAVVAIDGTIISFDGTSSDPAIQSSNNSTVSCPNSTISGHSGVNVLASASVVSMGSCSITGGVTGIFAEKSASVDATLVTISNVTGNGVLSRRAATVCIFAGSVTGSGEVDLAIEEGAWISARDCATSSTGAGSGPVHSDTNLTGGFNFSDNGGRGLIWS